MTKLKYFLCFLIFLCSTPAFTQDKPSKEEVLKSIMDINVSEEEAIEILAKYYPELLKPVIEAKKDFEQANTVQNSAEAGKFFQEAGRKSLDRKEFDQAIIYFQKAIVQKKKAQNGSEKHPDISATYQDLGKAYEGKEDFSEALRSYQRSLISNAADFNDADLLSNPKSSDIISNTLAIPIFEAKGNLLLQSENNETQLLAALMSYERGIEILDLVCKKYTSEYSQLKLSEQITILSEKAIQAALELYKTTRNKKYKNRIFTIAEKGKAMILTGTLLEAKAKSSSKVPDDILQKEQTLKVQIAQLSQRIKNKKDQAKNIKKEEGKFFALSQALFFLQDSLKTYYPEYDYLKFAPPNIAIDSLQTFLAEQDATLIEYFFGQKYAFAFTLTGDDFQITKLEDLLLLKKSILELRKDIQRQTFKTKPEEAFNTFTSNAKLIYGIALERPLVAANKNTSSLIIVPDAALWLIPFDLLLDGPVKNQELDFSPNNLPYLLNKYNISYASSSKLLLNNLSTSNNETLIPFVGFAPEFNSQKLASRSCFEENAALSDLDFNQTELAGIAAHFQGEAKYGPQANRKAFFNTAPKANILHLSTHACLNKADPMDSRIFFTDQEFITTKDIYAMKIQAKMTVLSACQTGLGQVYNGEGVLSLARAFSKAGCPSITMSLWPVADEATSTIMINYYDKLSNGINKSKALRQAKMDYINEQPKAKQHPYYWAAFVHLGDASPIQGAGFGSLFFWILLSGGVAILALILLKRR